MNINTENPFNQQKDIDIIHSRVYDVSTRDANGPKVEQKEPEQEFKYITPLAGAINIIKRINGIKLKEKRKEGGK